MLKFFRKFILYLYPRALPPAGSTISPLLVLTKILKKRDFLTESISSYFPNHNVYALNSGKGALNLTCSAIKDLTNKDNILLSAYTCPDVATSIIKSGLKISLFDLISKTTRPDLDSINKFIREKNPAAILFSNLYGFQDERPINISNEIFIINDSCQSALSLKDFPTLNEEIYVFSFGRGKAFCGAGGGLLLVPNSDNKMYSELNKKLTETYSKLENETIINSFIYYINLSIQWLLEKPFFYWFVLLIPGVGIGETKVKLNFKVIRAGRAKLALILSTINNFQNRKNELLNCLELYEKYLNDIPEGTIPIRIPYFIDFKIKEKIKTSFKSKKLGISISYPLPIYNYTDLKTYITNENTEELNRANEISNTIITLPLHKYLNSSDVEKIFKFLES